MYPQVALSYVPSCSFFKLFFYGIHPSHFYLKCFQTKTIYLCTLFTSNAVSFEQKTHKILFRSNFISIAVEKPCVLGLDIGHHFQAFKYFSFVWIHCVSKFLSSCYELGWLIFLIRKKAEDFPCNKTQLMISNPLLKYPN